MNPMNTPTEYWSISTDGGENYHGIFPSKEEAVADFKASMDGWLGTGYVGRCVSPIQPDELWDADDWLDDVSQHETYSLECASDWCSDITREQKRELEAEVKAVMTSWLDRHKLRPAFFLIEDAEKISMEESA